MVIKIYNKTKVFEKELRTIKNSSIKIFAEKSINALPDYFFEVAASSTGKYHPVYSLGSGGLVRHTKSAFWIADDLLNLEMYGKFTDDEKDLIKVAIILHDGRKHGETDSQFTIATHPLIMAEWIKSNTELSSILSEEYIQFLYDAISAHMGQWNTDYKTKKIILPKPKNKFQNFVHICDYLASRKYLIFDFVQHGDDYYDKDNYIENNLESLIQTIIDMCSDIIAKGVDKNIIYGIISDNNNNKKNPNSIKDVATATNIIQLLKEKLNEQ